MGGAWSHSTRASRAACMASWLALFSILNTAAARLRSSASSPSA
ncbi:hypothetical protein [Methylomagnum sp.]